MDVIDIASKREDDHRAAVIAAHLAQQKKISERPSAEHCEDCGGDIPEARRQIIPGVELCVECQDRQERMRR
ncbi:TraR/DksA C4-type zinc finger protein [Pseudomonas corrugata]|uniref:TraR/DksA C4-type zinc finger protein n=1 Tax=Pseudomonas corrugata TaxID=47879 RepID=UPI0006D8A9E3|nr:TraR/DksA C4-type zinc finger protein [Pseudomonas corrugata]